MQHDVGLLHKPIGIETRFVAVVRWSGREVAMSHRDNGAPFRASMSVRVWMRLVRAWLRAVRWCCVLVVASGWLIHSVPAMGSAPGAPCGAGGWTGGLCSVVSYSPAPWRVQYHRRCQA